jgi:hypothetical protein
MSVLNRVIQPVATAVIALAMLLVTLFFRPVGGATTGQARTMEPEHSVPMLPRAATTTTQQPAYDSTFDTVVLLVWLSGLAMILGTSLFLIWFRIRNTPGRHRSAA